jgi:hypothetical protein
LNKKICFEALESIFEVGFEFFSVFWLGLARNEESCRRWFCRKWWVTAGSAVVAGEVREKKKKKTRGVREGEAGCFVPILSLCIFS